MKQLIKELLLPGGDAIRRIPFGLARGVMMRLNFQSQFQRYLGLDEREVAGRVRKCLYHCRSAVDVGANDGYYTLVFLKSSVEQVVACEPGEAMQRLIDNAAANGFTPDARLRVERRLIGDGSDELSLRELVKDLPKPRLIKIDIDGGEVEALRSATGMIGLAETFWVVETHSVELERGCIAWFEQQGFSVEVIAPAWWRWIIPERRPLAQNRWLFASDAHDETRGASRTVVWPSSRAFHSSKSCRGSQNAGFDTPK
jgi:hypothetical protein